MTTRDIGSNQPFDSRATPTPLYIGEQTYYQLIACDGWPSGPCPSPAKALERVTAYERCEEVSEAAPKQASRAQMQSFLEWAGRPFAPPLSVYSGATREIGGLKSPAEPSPYIARLAADAIRDGLHSRAWIVASAELVRLASTRELPPHVINAGGTMVRRRLPDTQIPTRGA